MAQNFKQGLHITQTQSLRITPQIQQAIKLLQMTRMELENSIQKEIIENPILEEVHENLEDSAVKTEGDRRELKESDIGSKENDPGKHEHDDFNLDHYYDNTYHHQREYRRAGRKDELMNYENVIPVKTTLSDHLIWQIKTSGFNEEEVMIISTLVDYVDDNGYLEKPLDVIARETNIPLKDLEEHLPFLQEFDPPGVGARDLKECLLIQAKHLQENTEDIVTLITHHLKHLEQRNYAAVAKVMKQKIEYVKEMCKILEEMDPKPGRIFSTMETQHVIPDIYIYKVGDTYEIVLNDDGIPKLKISNHYRRELERNKNEGTQDYLKQKIKSANFLIQSIYRRQDTIRRVTESIVKHQKAFFEKGSSHIIPMNLKDIASDISMHESTVSRVTTNKYVHTPKGIFELKYFFSSSIKTNGKDLSSKSVKIKIKQLIEEENLRSPLSDQKIIDILSKQDGIKIARRTIAKYRELLGILPSSKRKKFFD